MENITNPEEVQLYQEFIATLSTDGTPWMPSVRSRFINSQRCPMIEKPELDKAYFLCEGCGSFYNEAGNSIGYFQAGSMIVYRQHDIVELYGQTFKVTEDGPHPKWVQPMMQARGKTYSERLPHIMEYLAVLGMQNTIKALLHFGYVLSGPFKYTWNDVHVFVKPQCWEMYHHEEFAASGDSTDMLIHVITGEGNYDQR